MGKSMNIVRYVEHHLPDGWRFERGALETGEHHPALEASAKHQSLKIVL
jgi:hypothetical protein